MSYYCAIPPNLALTIPPSPILLRYRFFNSPFRFSGRHNFSIRSSAKSDSSIEPLPSIRVAATSTILLIGISFGVWQTGASASTSLHNALAAKSPKIIVSQDVDDDGNSKEASFEDEQLNAAFETWKSKRMLCLFLLGLLLSAV